MLTSIFMIAFTTSMFDARHQSTLSHMDNIICSISRAKLIVDLFCIFYLSHLADKFVLNIENSGIQSFLNDIMENNRCI